MYGCEEGTFPIYFQYIVLIKFEMCALDLVYMMDFLCISNWKHAVAINIFNNNYLFDVVYDWNAYTNICSDWKHI